VTHRPAELIPLSSLTDEEIQTRWEDAYQRFETPEQEVSKFIQRLNKLGQKDWPRDTQIVDIFSGRCNGLKALERLGFTRLEGVDYSPNLLSKYDGPAKLHVADCRDLPFDDRSRDIIIVQGGLHHLPSLPDDLRQTLSEVRRVLKPEGKFVAVEPWDTPFLRFVHFLSEKGAIRRLSAKFDSFAAMAHYEAPTYYNWMKRPDEIRNLLQEYFIPQTMDIGWGKLYFVGRPN
jgi:ubiquinone/menaquinone biosynthesis C-methylase UbiE